MLQRLGLGWATSANMQSGDQNPGNGISTANRTVPGAVAADQNNIVGYQVAPGFNNHPVLGNSVAAWVAVVILYLVARWFLFKKGDESAGMSIAWIMDVTVAALIGSFVLKSFFSLVQVPAITPFVLSS